MRKVSYATATIEESEMVDMEATGEIRLPPELRSDPVLSEQSVRDRLKAQALKEGMNTESAAVDSVVKVFKNKKSTTSKKKKQADSEEADEEGDGEQDSGKKDPYKRKVQIVDEAVDQKQKVRVSLILDEVTDYLKEDRVEPGGQATWRKTVMHILNLGKAPICGAEVEVDEEADVRHVWTLRQVKDTTVYKLQWLDHLDRTDKWSSRYFGFVTKGKDAPDVKIASITPCDDEETEEESEEEGDGQARRLAELDEKDTVRMEVDALTQELKLFVDETQALGIADDREVILNGHVINTAEFIPICDIALWAYNFSQAHRTWQIIAESDKHAQQTDVFRLSRQDSRLQPGESAYFGFAVKMITGYPNLVVVRSGPCPDVAG